MLNTFRVTIVPASSAAVKGSTLRGRSEFYMMSKNEALTADELEDAIDTSLDVDISLHKDATVLTFRSDLADEHR